MAKKLLLRLRLRRRLRLLLLDRQEWMLPLVMTRLLVLLTTLRACSNRLLSDERGQRSPR